MPCRNSHRIFLFPLLSHHHHHFRLTSIFPHLGWGWSGNDCFPHVLILHHMLLYSHHTLTSLFPRHSYRPSSPNAHPPTSPSTPPLPFSHVQTISVFSYVLFYYILMNTINIFIFYFYFILLALPDKEFINTYYSLYKVA